MRISIVIPAYNEQKRIAKTLSKIFYYLKKDSVDAEVIIVDDGSRDDTFLIVNRFKDKYSNIIILRNDSNKGKGFSVRKGVLAAQGECILFIDADNSTPIQEMRKVVPLISDGKCDVALGSRSIEGSNVKLRQPYFRILMGRVFNLFVKCLFYRDFKDTQCGFKAFSKKAAQIIFERQTIECFSFDVEILAIAKVHNFKIQQVPVVWVNNAQSRVNPLFDSAQMFIDLFVIKINLLRKKYL